MIINLTNGDAQYVPDELGDARQDRVDIDLTCWLQCHGETIFKSPILPLLAHREDWLPLGMLVLATETPIRELADNIADLMALGLLEEHLTIAGPAYRIKVSGESGRILSWLRPADEHRESTSR